MGCKAHASRVQLHSRVLECGSVNLALIPLHSRHASHAEFALPLTQIPFPKSLNP